LLLPLLAGGGWEGVVGAGGKIKSDPSLTLPATEGSPFGTNRGREIIAEFNPA
jgi:hypothetical protein